MTTTIDVGTESDLNAAIGTIDVASGTADYVIRLTGDITENAALSAISSGAGVTTTIDGGGFTLDGAGTYQGLFVYSGVLTVENLTIANAIAQGGSAVPGGGGGGGAGLGGGLFIAGSNGTLATGGTVTLSGVNFSDDSATGGAGQIGGGGNGGALSGSTLSLGLGGAGNSLGSGYPGGFGGGGGGAGSASGGAGGFGGFGGGGGGTGSSNGVGGGGGFGAGDGVNSYSGGGGGLGAGGDIFVQQGGSLTIGAGSLSAGTVTGGARASVGGASSAFGSAMFLQGDQTITLAPGSGETLIVDGVIADQTGSGGTGGNAGSGGIAATGGGRIVFNAVDTYSGTTSLDGGTTIELGASASATGSTLAFLGNATLLLDALGATFNGITGFTGAGDVLDFAGVTPGSVPLSQSVDDTATIDGMVVTGTFGTLTQAPDGSGGTLITAACFRQGTRIATTRGDVAVERLRAGDRAITASGAPRPIVWVGHRTVTVAHHPRPWDVMPVRVQAHAFGPAQPCRDLFLSPDHAVHVDDALIPIRYLLNGGSVAQQSASRVTWWHVELDQHDAIIADGLPAESYLDTGNRGAFANGGAVVQAHPDFSRAVWDARSFAPLVTRGAVLRRVRERLLARLAGLGHATTDDPDLRVLAGAVTLQAARDGEWLRVTAPPEAGTLRLVSRVARPAELHPDSDDWRALGVAVTGLRLDGADLAFDDPRLGPGWLAPEPAMRWTDGDATLQVPGGAAVDIRTWRCARYHAAGAAGQVADATGDARRGMIAVAVAPTHAKTQATGTA